MTTASAHEFFAACASVGGALIGLLFVAEGKVPDQWEMYDLKTDPLERTNLAFKHYKRNARQQREYRRLRRKLAQVEQTRLQPLS